MPIQFVCPGCQQSLLARDEHALRWVRCPQCREVLVVPTESPSRKAAAESSAESGLIAEPITEPAASGDEASGKLDEAAAGAAGIVRARGTLIAERVAVPRWMFYAHAGLLALVAVAALAAGMWIGRAGHERVVKPAEPSPALIPSPLSPPLPQALGRPVEIVGKLTWHGIRRDFPDSDAVVIVLPETVWPNKKIPAAELAPTRPVPAATHPALLAIKDLGGTYARTGHDGRFSLRVVPGRYRMLLISRETRRPAGVAPRPDDLLDLGKYFTPPEGALGDQKYRLSSMELREGSQIDCFFGESGKP